MLGLGLGFWDLGTWSSSVVSSVRFERVSVCTSAGTEGATETGYQVATVHTRIGVLTTSNKRTSGNNARVGDE